MKGRPKYRNEITATADGISHASKKQAKRWGELVLLQKAGKIRDLRREVPYRLEVNGQLVCKYVADHVYIEVGYRHFMDTEVVEDVKSDITRKNRAYRIKCKLMKACHGITISEV